MWVDQRWVAEQYISEGIFTETLPILHCSARRLESSASSLVIGKFNFIVCPHYGDSIK